MSNERERYVNYLLSRVLDTCRCKSHISVNKWRYLGGEIEEFIKTDTYKCIEVEYKTIEIEKVKYISSPKEEAYKKIINRQSDMIKLYKLELFEIGKLAANAAKKISLRDKI